MMNWLELTEADSGAYWADSLALTDAELTRALGADSLALNDADWLETR